MPIFHVHEGLFVVYSQAKKNCDIKVTTVLILLSLWSFNMIFAFKTADVGQSLAMCTSPVCLILCIFPDRSNIPHTMNCKSLSNFGFCSITGVPGEQTLVIRKVIERCELAAWDFLLVRTLHSRSNVCQYTLKSYAFCKLQEGIDTGWHRANVLCCNLFPNKWVGIGAPILRLPSSDVVEWLALVCMWEVPVWNLFPKIVCSDKCFISFLSPST